MKRIVSVGIILLVMLCYATFPTMAAQKEWTWMVFLNADNNLDMFGRADLKEMSKVGSSEFLNIVALIDHEGGPASLTYVEKNHINILKDMGNVDMGDYRNLVSFVTETVRDYPANHYALVIWNHGNGWFKSGNTIDRGISYDESSGHHITTLELGHAMDQISKSIGKKVDILAMDACLMQMMEVLYVVKDSCDYVVASEEIEPSLGYPYIDILQGLNKNTTPLELAKHIVAAYTASYNGGSQGKYFTTLSAIDCSKLDALKEAIDALAEISMTGKYTANYASALNGVQHFYFDTNIDLVHLVERLKSIVKDEAFLAIADKLEKALGNAIIAFGNTGEPKKNAKGLAIYFPDSAPDYSLDYDDLTYSQESLWDDMLKKYYQSKIIGDVANGDLSSLNKYVDCIGAENYYRLHELEVYDFNKELVTRLNFRLFTENPIAFSLQEQLNELIIELKKKRELQND